MACVVDSRWRMHVSVTLSVTFHEMQHHQTLPCTHCSLLHYAFSQFLTSGRGRHTSVTSARENNCMQALTTSMSRAWWLCPCPDILI